MTDVLHDALRDATLAVLLGTQAAPYQSHDPAGNPFQGTITIKSAFEERIRARTHNGDFDALIDEAIEMLSPGKIADALVDTFANLILKGLEPRERTWGEKEPGWLQEKAKSIAVAACTAALSEDEALKDTLREKIGMQVDRNRIGISVSLTDPEK